MTVWLTYIVVILVLLVSFINLIHCFKQFIIASNVYYFYYFIFRWIEIALHNYYNNQDK